MARIVLAHGILGFGSVFPLVPLDYFNGIHRPYTGLGHDVLCPTVPALGSIAVRSHELRQQILNRWPGGIEPVFLLGHSMGGLDCRYMLQNDSVLAARVRRLVTVATPHYGSPVASALLHPAPLGLPSPIQLLTGFFSGDAGALADLQTRTALQSSNSPSVEYLCIGCDATATNPRSPLFALAAAIGDFDSLKNDGVVSLDSASSSNDATSLFQTWPVDHGGAIGWPSGGLGRQTREAALRPPSDHLARFEDLLATLIA